MTENIKFDYWKENTSVRGIIVVNTEHVSF